MRSSTLVLSAALLLSATVPSQASRFRRGPTSAHHKPTKQKATRANTVSHQRAIDDARATQIQGALVKAGYLPSVTGHWDGASESALQKLQKDNGWQTKIVPDSRALIKLGLGPNAEPSAAPAVAKPAEADTHGGK